MLHAVYDHRPAVRCDVLTFLSEMFLPVSLEIDLLLRIADKTNQRRTRYSSALLFFGLVHFLQEPLECAPAFDAGLVLDAL